MLPLIDGQTNGVVAVVVLQRRRTDILRVWVLLTMAMPDKAIGSQLQIGDLIVRRESVKQHPPKKEVSEGRERERERESKKIFKGRRKSEYATRSVCVPHSYIIYR